MHLLQIYKLFPFREDLEEFMEEAVWSDWPKDSFPRPDSSNPLEGLLLADPDIEPQQWLLALHLIITWPDRSDPTFIMRELEIDSPTAHTVIKKVKEALTIYPDFYSRLAKSLGACTRCG